MKIKLRLLLFFIFLFCNTTAFASSWDDLWVTANQQSQKLFNKGKYKQAAKKFEDSAWQGSAHYRAGQYEEAFRSFSKTPSAQNYYNRGNALAHLGKYREAIAAYDESLKLQPDDKDAQYNRDLLKKLLEQEKQQQQKQQQNSKQNQDKKQQQQQNQQDKQQQNKPQDQEKEPDPKESEKQPEKNDKDKDKKENKEQKNNTKKTEAQQAAEQWLRRVPDDPGGLLKQKFLRDHLRRKNQDAQL